MKIKYDTEVSIAAIEKDLKKLTNQIYKLLPNREEGIDWINPLQTIMEELAGMNRLLIDQEDIFFSLLCKLEGLFILTDDKEDFFLYRRTIFECLSLINEIKECLV